MRTVSTKLDKTDHERFIDLCNQEGQTPSEALRSLIQEFCNSIIDIDDNEEPELYTMESDKPRIFDCTSGFLYENGTILGKCDDYGISQGEVYDKKGKHLGTIKH